MAGGPFVVAVGGRGSSLACAIAALGVALLVASTAVAYDESVPATWPPLGHSTPYAECTKCHGADPASSNDCMDCHGPGGGFPATQQYGKGPHAGYTTTSSRCELCHTIHDASSDFALLPGPTITATCDTCHDGTGGQGVYGAIRARTGANPGGMHRTETTSTIPGGDSATGGSSAGLFSGTGDTLTCTDCHSPHNSNTVPAFLGERRRIAYSTVARESWQSLESNRLLKKRPTGAVADAAEYGSDWCLACHRGRSSGGAVHNHPADSKALRADAFTYGNVAALNSDNPTSITVTAPLGANNRGYLMPYPRTPQQGTHYPICQQCHEDSRDPGALDASGAAGDAATFTPSLDGTSAAGNPRFQNFPHETVNPTMLVQRGDDLCLNCHPATALP